MNKPPYDITSSILDLYGKINERLGQCKGLMLVRPEAQLRRENRIKTIQSSLAIEGNTLEIEQVTAILNNQRVLAPAKDILEVQNANLAYELLPTLKSHSIDDFLRTHRALLKGLVEEAGKYRSNDVEIVKGTEVKHVAPGSNMVPSLMNNIFDYLRKSKVASFIMRWSSFIRFKMEMAEWAVFGRPRYLWRKIEYLNFYQLKQR